MSFSFLNWRNACVALVLTTYGCDGSVYDWPTVNAIDDGGFSVEMPGPGASQNGAVIVGTDTFNTHINILADSGITYTAAWADLPTGFKAQEPTDALDSFWSVLAQRVNGGQLDEDGPLENTLSGTRNGWFINSDGVRLGVVLHRMNDRFVILNSATPNNKFGDPQKQRMLRFLRSFKLADQ